MILLLVAHIGAALRHRFVLHDGIMSRMAPKTPDGRWAAGVVPLSAAVVIIVAGLIAHGLSGKDSVPLAAGDSRVSFTFTVQDQSARASFAESTVELSLDADNPASSSLHARVNTASVTAGNSQVDSTLVGGDWFDVENHPQASFTSSALVPVGENSYRVSGTLTIRGIARDLTFPLNLAEAENRRMASGSFTLDRLDFDLGRSSQADDDTVAYPVEVEFEFEVR